MSISADPIPSLTLSNVDFFWFCRGLTSLNSRDHLQRTYIWVPDKSPSLHKPTSCFDSWTRSQRPSWSTAKHEGPPSRPSLGRRLNPQRGPLNRAVSFYRSLCVCYTGSEWRCNGGPLTARIIERSGRLGFAEWRISVSMLIAASFLPNN